MSRQTLSQNPCTCPAEVSRGMLCFLVSALRPLSKHPFCGLFSVSFFFFCIFELFLAVLLYKVAPTCSPEVLPSVLSTRSVWCASGRKYMSEMSFIRHELLPCCLCSEPTRCRKWGLWPPNAKSWFIGKDLMLGKIEGKRRRGWQRIKWLVSITNSKDISLSKLQEIGRDREGLACCSPWGHKELDMT